MLKRFIEWLLGPDPDEVERDHREMQRRLAERAARYDEKR